MASILKRVSHRFLVVGAAALLTVGTYAVAQEDRGDHPDTYVVKRGDTLWDIAGRFLRKPWLWPEIWQANPQIANPHLIYPGDVISLAYLDRVGVQPGPRTEAPINAIALSDIEAYLRDLRVVDSFEELPYVVGLEEDITRGVIGHLAYARGLDSAQVGQRYAIVRPTTRYVRIGKRECCDMLTRNHYDFRGKLVPGFGQAWSDTAGADVGREELGHELYKVNAGTVTKLMEGDVEVTTLRLDDRNVEVRVGDRLIPVDAQPYDLQFFPHAPKQPIDMDKARVLAVANSLTSGGPRDVIAISAGAQDGIDNGTVLSIWRQGSNAVDRVQEGYWRGEETVPKGRRVQLPDEYSGHVMIFRTFDKVSYGLVMEGVKPSRVGYRLKHPDAK
ncbi:MAG: LysM peptidoglycan-binding domain-containing protein [Pseudomonadota bacterium]